MIKSPVKEIPFVWFVVVTWKSFIGEAVGTLEVVHRETVGALEGNVAAYDQNPYSELQEPILSRSNKLLSFSFIS
jgi:hypothetical protein